VRCSALPSPKRFAQAGLNPSQPARLLPHRPKGSSDIGMALCHGKKDAYFSKIGLDRLIEYD
jgi:hypothetical protein